MLYRKDVTTRFLNSQFHMHILVNYMYLVIARLILRLHNIFYPSRDCLPCFCALQPTCKHLRPNPEIFCQGVPEHQGINLQIFAHFIEGNKMSYCTKNLYNIVKALSLLIRFCNYIAPSKMTYMIVEAAYKQRLTYR